MQCVWNTPRSQPDQVLVSVDLAIAVNQQDEATRTDMYPTGAQAMPLFRIWEIRDRSDKREIGSDTRPLSPKSYLNGEHRWTDMRGAVVKQ